MQHQQRHSPKTSQMSKWVTALFFASLLGEVERRNLIEKKQRRRHKYIHVHTHHAMRWEKVLINFHSSVFLDLN